MSPMQISRMSDLIPNKPPPVPVFFVDLDGTLKTSWEMSEGEYEIEYASAATRIQREEEVQGIRATYVDLAGIAEIDPSVREMLDSPAAVRFIAEARGVPPFLIRTEKDFEDILLAQAEKAKEQEAIANARELAATAKDAKAGGIDVQEQLGM